MDGQVALYNVDGENYAAFTEKFKPKLTTDDCYTPEPVYEAVADWAAWEYGVSRERFVRPFWPGGDYRGEAEGYEPGTVVVDNPPFSILAEIIRFYCAAGVRFFLFAPALTLFTATECPVCYLPVAVNITYANGAKVNTSFVTNLDRARVRCCPSLFRTVDAANKAVQAALVKAVPKYEYPPEVITAARCQRWTRYGVEFAASAEDCVYVGALDAQRAARKSIFGGGFLLRPAAAAAAAAAAEQERGEVWELSARERRMIGMEAEDADQESLF